MESFYSLTITIFPSFYFKKTIEIIQRNLISDIAIPSNYFGLFIK